MTFDIEILGMMLVGYVVGSIPFGLLLTKAAGMGDVRDIGSGNIGATNVLRTGNKGLAAATLLFDMLKGFVPVFFAWWVSPPAAGWTLLGVVLGHCFPVWLKFKGGKGVATLGGACFGLLWPVGLAYAVTWIGLLAITRISSVAGMSAPVVAAIAAVALGWWRFGVIIGVAALLIFWLHRANIGRLFKGEEPKVGGNK
ncbi:MAG: glycerol-3-phosphate 1-O-acyltransferase PlsY [Erythrobacter sp.]